MKKGEKMKSFCNIQYISSGNFIQLKTLGFRTATTKKINGKKLNEKLTIICHLIILLFFLRKKPQCHLI